MYNPLVTRGASLKISQWDDFLYSAKYSATAFVYFSIHLIYNAKFEPVLCTIERLDHSLWKKYRATALVNITPFYLKCKLVIRRTSLNILKFTYKLCVNSALIARHPLGDHYLTQIKNVLNVQDQSFFPRNYSSTMQTFGARQHFLK